MNQTIITEDDLIFMKKIDDEEAERKSKIRRTDRKWYDGEAERIRKEDLELQQPNNPEWLIEDILRMRGNRTKKLKRLQKQYMKDDEEKFSVSDRLFDIITERRRRGE